MGDTRPALEGKHNKGRPLDADAELQAALNKLHWNILPVFVAVAAVCYLDRTNLAFASVSLTHDLQFDAEVYGLGSGVFFIGYAAFQLPSQLVLMKLGAPRWLSYQVVAWGATACMFAAMSGKASFYGLRFLLGVAEAGAFPGIWAFINSFYPPDLITVPYSAIEASVGLANVIAAPLAASLLQLDGVLGLRGWQWLFLLEGVPSIMLGLWMGLGLPRDPEEAVFLTASDKRILGEALTLTRQHAREGADAGSVALLSMAASNRRVWLMGLVAFLKGSAMTGMLFWVPKMVDGIVYGAAIDESSSSPVSGGGHGAGGSARRTGSAAVLLSAVPFVCAAAAAVWLSARSQRVGEKALHVAVPYIVCAALLLSFPAIAATAPWLGFMCLTLLVTMLNAPNAVLNSMAAHVGKGPAQPLAMAIYNSVGNVGGLVGPWLIGAVVHNSGVYTAAMQVLGLLMAMAAALVHSHRRYWAQQ